MSSQRTYSKRIFSQVPTLASWRNTYKCFHTSRSKIRKVACPLQQVAIAILQEDKSPRVRGKFSSHLCGKIVSYRLLALVPAVTLVAAIKEI
jgi:hypothetical protein